MVRIAICDDDVALCGSIEELIVNAVYIHNGDIDLDVFYDGESLVEHMKKGNRYEIIFLDIQLVKMNGVSVGHNIREVLDDNNVQIVYISVSYEYVLELFEVRPMNFLIKPVSDEKMYRILEQAFDLIEKKNILYEYKVKKQSNFIAINNIQYFEIDNRKITIHAKDKDIVYYGSMSEVIKKLDRRRFIRISRSELVNFDEIEMYTPDEITLYGGEVLQITRTRQKEVRKQVMSYVKEEM